MQCKYDQLKFWVSVAQREVYSDVIDVLQSAREMPQSAPLQKLCPQLDSTSGAPVLCVGGRLRAAHHLAGVSSPIILPPKHRIRVNCSTRRRQTQSWSRKKTPTVQSCGQILDCSWKTGGQSVPSHMHKMPKIWRKAA